MSLLSNVGSLTNLQFGLLIGLSALAVLVLIAIIATAVTMTKKNGQESNNTPAPPQVIILSGGVQPVSAPISGQVPMPVAATVQQPVQAPVPIEPVYAEITDDTDEEEDVLEVEPEEEVYDGVPIEEQLASEENDEIELVALDDGMKVVSDDAVVFKSSTRRTFDEAYAALSKEQKSFFDGILKYALAKPDAKEFRTKSNVRVKSKGALIVKLLIRRDTVVTSYSIENDMLKVYRKELAKNDGAKITVKATDISIVDADAFEAAKGLVDVAYEQIEHERELQKEARRERRRQAREAKKSE